MDFLFWFEGLRCWVFSWRKGGIERREVSVRVENERMRELRVVEESIGEREFIKCPKKAFYVVPKKITVWSK